LDNPDDQERLIKAVARGEALTSAAPTKAIPKTFQPLFKHPLPISDHSGYHESNLKRVQCCKLEKQAAAAVTLADSWVLEEVYLNGAPVDIPDKNGFSPIHTAVKVNSFECVMALINMKVNINATTLTGVTPLFLAKSVSSKEIVQALVENDGVVEVKNHDEIAPIEFLEVGKARDKSLLDLVDDSLGPRRNTLF
jgi:ankyrin repeat protein